jgi:Fe2+ transport system protein B
MTEPEIDRRCCHCGVSIRERAFFCPQCGKPLAGDHDGSDENAEPAQTDQPSLTETIADRRIETLNIDATAHREPLIEVPGIEPESQASRDREPLFTKIKTPVVLTPERRSTAAALEDNVLQRVERLRKVSSIMIDQAAYDPSLRFVLVAALLFFLFLVIVLVSKLIG